MQRLVRCQQNMQRLVGPSNRPSDFVWIWRLFTFGACITFGSPCGDLGPLMGISELHSGISEPLAGISELHWYIYRKVNTNWYHRVRHLAQRQSARLRSRRLLVRNLVVALLFARCFFCHQDLFLSSIIFLDVTTNGEPCWNVSMTQKTNEWTGMCKWQSMFRKTDRNVNPKLTNFAVSFHNLTHLH